MIYADKLTLTFMEDGVKITSVLVDVYVLQTREKLVINNSKNQLTEYDLSDIIYIEVGYSPKNFNPFSI